MRASGGFRPRSDVDALIDLGCDLADAGRQTDAEWCFRRAADLGDTVASFNLGNALAAQQRWEEAVAAYELALAGGEPDAWRNLGKVLEDLGDLAGAMRAYRGAADAGDLEGGLQLAFLLREQGERHAAMDVAMEIAGHGRPGGGRRRRLLALVRDPRSRRWRPTSAPAPTSSPRPAPTSPTCCGRPAAPIEARFVLERGAKLGEAVAWLPLGNFYADEMAGRRGRGGGLPRRHRRRRAYCHHNLAVLLAERGDFDGAVEQFRLGAAAGDQLAADALRELEHG